MLTKILLGKKNLLQGYCGFQDKSKGKGVCVCNPDIPIYRFSGLHRNYRTSTVGRRVVAMVSVSATNWEALGLGSNPGGSVGHQYGSWVKSAAGSNCLKTVKVKTGWPQLGG